MRDEFRKHRARHGRKGRVLHTRVSEQLSEDIRRLAEDLRVPASNLVRNVLEEVFDAVEHVSDDVGEVFEDVLAEADSARDCIERQLRRRRRRHGGRRRDRDRDDDIENELRRDEEAEARADGEGERKSADRPDAEDVEARPVPEFPEVVGWQMLVLNAASQCGVCERQLKRGDRAYLGLTENGFSPHRLCRRCVPS